LWNYIMSRHTTSTSASTCATALSCSSSDH
jgi:hypothetical protein